jgi:hypothetical protein
MSIKPYRNLPVPMATAGPSFHRYTFIGLRHADTQAPSVTRRIVELEDVGTSLPLLLLSIYVKSNIMKDLLLLPRKS